MNNDENTSLETTENEATELRGNVLLADAANSSVDMTADSQKGLEVQRLKQALSEVYDLRLTIMGNLIQLQADAPMVNSHPLVAISLLKLDAIGDIITAAIV